MKEQNPIKRNILLTPGPATTSDGVKYAQVIPDICHREKEFTDILQEIRTDLVRIVKGRPEDYTSVLFGGSGTAVMDAVINSVVPEGKKLAVIVNGAYGERIIKIAGAYSIPCVEIKSNYGERIDILRVEDVLNKDPMIACVAIIHHETTTGILNPVKEIGQICREKGIVYIVDSISSFAGIPIDIKEYNIDFMMSTSNKCIQGMAGIAFAICKIIELEKIKKYPARSFYLNLYNQYKYIEETGQTPFTPPVQVVYALRQAIREYFEEGGENRYKRYSENYEILKNWLKEMGFRFLLDEKDESKILMTIYEPDNPAFNFDEMHAFLYERGFTIYPGKITDKKTFRLASMGAIYPEDIRNFIKSVKDFLEKYQLVNNA